MWKNKQKDEIPLLYFLDTFERAVLKSILCSEKLQIIARVLIIFFFSRVENNL